MYKAKITIERIQSMIKERGYTQKNVLSECGINENTLKRMTDNKGISSFYLAKIADKLNCSVDYLLGRTDSPNISETNIIKDNQQNNVNGNSSINIGDIGDNSSNNNHIQVSAISESENEIRSVLSELTPRERTELMMIIYQFSDEHKKE